MTDDDDDIVDLEYILKESDYAIVEKYPWDSGEVLSFRSGYDQSWDLHIDKFSSDQINKILIWIKSRQEYLQAISDKLSKHRKE